MANLSDAIARVCSDYLVRPEDEVGDVVGREIQAAIDHYAGERFGFNEKRLTFTLSATDAYALDDIASANGFRRIIEIDEVVVTNQGGNRSTLTPVSWEEMLYFRASQNSYGEPSRFVRYADNLHIDTYPTSYTMDSFIDCHVEFVTLEASLDNTNEFIREGYDLICARAARMTAMKKLREYDHAAQFASLESECLNSLRERGFRRMAGGRLVPSL